MREYLERCKFFFIHAGIFSFFINLLLLTMPLYMLQVFDRVLNSRSEETLLMLTLLALGALMVWALLELLRSRLMVRAGLAFDHLLGEKVLHELVEHANVPGKQHYSSALRDVNLLRNYLLGPNILALFDVPWTPLFLGVIYLFHPVFGLIAIGGMVVMFALALMDERISKRILERAHENNRQASRFVELLVRNAEVVKALGMVGAATRKWRRHNDQASGYYALASNRSSVIQSASKFTRVALQVGMMGFGAWLVIDQNLSPGIMMAATLILGRAMAPVERAIAGWKGFIEARSAYHRLDGLLREMQARHVSKLQLPPPKGNLSVEAVLYGGGDGLILKRVSFALRAGESLGIVGPSAAGKSTLARVVMGIHAPLSGTVRLDGASLADWDRVSLGRYLGYLPQDIELFDGTVAENIARFTDASGNDEQVIEAARRARVHELILRLPEGYNTLIGAGGVILSGGQRQRIALARALFGQPRLVLLDEPNSNLDSDGEMALLQVLQWLKEQGITTLLITHKIGLLGNMDKILVLRDGQVEKFGPCRDILQGMMPRQASAPAREKLGTG